MSVVSFILFKLYLNWVWQLTNGRTVNHTSNWAIDKMVPGCQTPRILYSPVNDIGPLDFHRTMSSERVSCHVLCQRQLKITL